VPLILFFWFWVCCLDLFNIFHTKYRKWRTLFTINLLVVTIVQDYIEVAERKMLRLAHIICPDEACDVSSSTFFGATKIFITCSFWEWPTLDLSDHVLAHSYSSTRLLAQMKRDMIINTSDMQSGGFSPFAIYISLHKRFSICLIRSRDRWSLETAADLKGGLGELQPP
jgi:hypothetical protein